jgi:hypothetical protein
MRMCRVIRGCIQKFPDGRLERELQMEQLPATRCSCIAILWVSLVSFAAITHCVASQRVFIVVVYFVMTQSRNFWIYPRIARRWTSWRCHLGDQDINWSTFLYNVAEWSAWVTQRCMFCDVDREEGLRKTTKDSKSFGQDSNMGTSRYDTRELGTI